MTPEQRAGVICTVLNQIFRSGWYDDRDEDAIRQLIAGAIRDERELCAQTAEWEHAHGTNGVGIAAAIRNGHSRAE